MIFPLEGTNFGLKHVSLSTYPVLSMDNPMVIFSEESHKHNISKTNGKVIKYSKRHYVHYKRDATDITMLCNV